MRAFLLRWGAVALAHELLGAWVASHPLTSLAGARSGGALALGVTSFALFWAARLALIVVLPGVLVARVISRARR